jgi:hypothetical protein
MITVGNRETNLVSMVAVKANSVKPRMTNIRIHMLSIEKSLTCKSNKMAVLAFVIVDCNTITLGACNTNCACLCYRAIDRAVDWLFLMYSIDIGFWAI